MTTAKKAKPRRRISPSGGRPASRNKAITIRLDARLYRDICRLAREERRPVADWCYHAIGAQASTSGKIPLEPLEGFEEPGDYAGAAVEAS